MLRYYPVIFVLACLFLLNCHEEAQHKNNLPKKKSEAKDDFLKSINTEQSLDVIKAQLDSANIGLSEVYEYCRKQFRADYRKSRLIAAVFYDAQNYLEEENPEYWLAIMYDLQRFSEQISLLKQPEHRSFLDVGSGNGEKPYAALCLGFEKSYGIEYSKPLVKISQNLLAPFIQTQQIEIIGEDALKVPDNFYQKIDFIYFYSPIKDHQLMAQLFYRTLQNLKEGGRLLEMRFVYQPQLCALSGLAFPELSSLVIKKEKGKYYYAQYSNSQIDWFLLEKQ